MTCHCLHLDQEPKTSEKGGEVMGHTVVAELEGDGELWTGDAFEYFYVQMTEGDGKERSFRLPSEVLYEQLRVELVDKVQAELDSGEHDWTTLAAVLDLLKSRRELDYLRRSRAIEKGSV